MTVKKKHSMRNRIDENCRQCIYDNGAAGTWRQQVTLCPVTSCTFHDIRPISKSAIPESTLDYYMLTGSEHAFYARSRVLEGTVNGYYSAQQCQAEGAE